MKTTLEIDLNDTQIMQLTVAELLFSYQCCGLSTHPEDIKSDKKLKKALKRVLRHYMMPSEYEKLEL